MATRNNVNNEKALKEASVIGVARLVAGEKIVHLIWPRGVARPWRGLYYRYGCALRISILCARANASLSCRASSSSAWWH